jgi:putative transposase
MRTTTPMQNPKVNMPHHIEPTNKLNTMRTEAHTTYNVNYHIVTIPKYRRHILRHPRFKEILREIVIGQAESRFQSEVLAFEIQPDHIHLFLSVPPKYSAAQVVKQIKGNSSRQLRRIFPDLIKQYRLGEHLWARGYFVSTAGYISEDTVKRYIDEQEHHRLRDEWNKSHPKGRQKKIGG